MAKLHNSPSNKITIIAELGTCIYAVKPIVKEFVDRGFAVDLYTEEANLEKTKNYLNNLPLNILSTSVLMGRWASLFDYIFKQLITKNTFSSQYARLAPSNNKLLSLIYKCAKYFPKPNQKKINSIYHKFWRMINRKPVFNSRKVLVITRTNNTYYLNNRNHLVYSIMESWDHPVKSPFYFLSEVTFTWNASLTEDMRAFQNNSKHYSEIFPLKFRYLQEIVSVPQINSVALQKEIDFINTQPYVLYICTYSGYSKGDLFHNELKLIAKIKEQCDKAGKLLYIKPHPHYSASDFDSLSSSRNLRVGIGATNNGTNYIFTDDDQYYKIQLLKNAEKIINVGTTLVLEASLLNENVYQLKIDSSRYGSFARACENYHIAKYLNSYSEIIDLTCGDESEKIEKLMKEDKGSNHYAAQIKKWLFNEEIETSINKIVNEISK